MPRITPRQAMDALSAMSTVSGYKAVLDGRQRLPQFFPLLMTAAGTVTPAQVFSSAPASPDCRRSAPPSGSARSSKPTTRGPPSGSRSRVSAASSSSWAWKTKDAGGQDRLRQGAVGGVLPEAAGADGAVADQRTSSSRRPWCRARRRRSSSPRRWCGGMRPGSVIVDLAAEQGGNCELTSRARRS